MYFIPVFRRGIFNRYRKGMPVTEMFTKDLFAFASRTKNFFRYGRRKHTLFVYPHYPSRGSTLFKAAAALGLNLTNKFNSNCIAAICWEYNTQRNEYAFVESLPENIKKINLFSRDISKTYVDHVFSQITGRTTLIDPLVYEGTGVIKSNTNALHDGKIIQFPLSEKKSGCIYQKLIDNRYDEQTVVDIRVPVVVHALPYVYLKYRKIDERFRNTTVRTVVKPIREVLNHDEQEMINRFCAVFKLDYGELDILRDRSYKQIYIVDVNNTPQGPPANTPTDDGKKMIRLIAAEFCKAFLSSYPYIKINPS